MIKVLIVDAYMQGYVSGKEYLVEPAEAKRLVEGNYAKIISPAAQPKKENAADSGPAKAEKAVVK
jgi:hypothetical protein